MAAPLLDLPARPATSPPRPAAILDLYGGRWEGELLHPGDYVVCCDEKPSIQARRRKHPTLPAAAGVKRGQRVEHEYERKGALCYLAAWDARRAKLFDRCAPKDGIVPFDALVEQFMSGRALQQGAARVRDRRQRLRAPRPTLDRPPPRRLAKPASSSTPRSTPAGSTRPRSTSPSSSARSSPPTTSPTSTRSSSSCSPSAAATSRSPPRSNGSSPAPTSTASPSDSTYPPPRPPDLEYVGELPSQSTKPARAASRLARRFWTSTLRPMSGPARRSAASSPAR